MAILIRCDKCQAEVRDARISKLRYDGFEVSLNRLRNTTDGNRADLCEPCFRDVLAKGEAVET